MDESIRFVRHRSSLQFTSVGALVRCSVYLPLLDMADAACAAPPAGTPALLVLDTEQWAARRLLEAHQSVSALQTVLSVVTS
jgi:hypothetical protein